MRKEERSTFNTELRADATKPLTKFRSLSHSNDHDLTRATHSTGSSTHVSRLIIRSRRLPGRRTYKCCNWSTVLLHRLALNNELGIAVGGDNTQAWSMLTYELDGLRSR